MEAALAMAAEQHGVISLDQIRALGSTRAQLRTAVRHGVLIPVSRRVYVVGGAPATVEQEQMAGLLCLGAGAVLSHEAAARLHQFDRCLPDAVEFTVPRHRSGLRTPFVVHTSKRLTALDQVSVAGWPCTSATRTIIDLARTRISTVRLEAAIDTAVRTGASAPVVIADRLAELRGPGGWGAPRLDHLLVDTGGHTLLERRFLRLMREAGLPRPTTQLVHRVGGRTVARTDFCFEDHGLVVEVSGRRGHSSPAERARDAQRRNELQDLGRQVYEFTFEQVMKDGAAVQETVRRCLGRASSSSLRPRSG
jgi:very-short-patch-repair endonuclease